MSSRGGFATRNSPSGPLSLQHAYLSSSRADGGRANGREADLVQQQHNPATRLPSEAVRGELPGKKASTPGLHEMHQWGGYLYSYIVRKHAWRVCMHLRSVCALVIDGVPNIYNSVVI